MSTIQYSNHRNKRTSGALAQLFIEGVLGDVEIWKDILGYEGLYAVSNWGRVKSLTKSFFLKPWVVGGLGHLMVRLYNRYGETADILVHRLVLEMFVGSCPEGMQCCHHPDRTPNNNHLGNLRWDTRKNNQADRKQCGNDHYTVSQKGEEHYNAVTTADDVREMRALHTAKKATPKELSKKYGLGMQTVYAILSRRNWKHIE